MLGRLMTSKFPLVVILAELAAQLRRRSLRLDLQRAPRGQNEEADDLTNREFGRSAAANRARLDVKGLTWVVLGRQVKVAADLYADIVSPKRKAPDTSCQARGPKAQRPRERDLW